MFCVPSLFLTAGVSGGAQSFLPRVLSISSQRAFAVAGPGLTPKMETVASVDLPAQVESLDGRFVP